MSSFLFTTNQFANAPAAFAISILSNGIGSTPTGGFPEFGFMKSAQLAMLGSGSPTGTPPGAMIALFSGVMAPGGTACFVPWPIMQGGRPHFACFTDV